MRIVVCVKQVYDPATIKISRSREDFDLRQAVKRTNSLDRYAIEAALRVRETVGGEVIALAVGDAGAEDVLHEAVAMGADHGVLVADAELAKNGGAGITRVIAAVVDRLGAIDLLLTGPGDPVSGTGSLAARLATALNWQLVLDALCLEHAGDEGWQAVVPDASGAARAVPLSFPAVAVISAGAERPRYPHAQRIANAYKPGLIDVWSAADLGFDVSAQTPEMEAGGLVLGPERTRGQVLGGSADEAANAVLELLRNKRLL